MDEDRARFLAEWYGAGEAETSAEQADPAGTGCISSQIPPSRPDGSLAAGDVPRKRRAAVRAAGICFLAVLVIAASALLFSGGSYVPHGGSPDEPEQYADYREYFEHYYENAASSAGEIKLPEAETGTGVTLTLTPRPEGGALDLAGVYERCSSSVVAITSSAGDGRYIWGSGIIMTADGYILTNAHVLEGAVESTVTLWDDREYEARLVGADSASDLAVIKINAVGLPAAEFCADAVSVGEAVAAIGNPLGPELRGTMTDGIISALSRDISYTNHPMTLIQTNVAINEGNSGGPLLNMYGQVVGMTSMKLVSAYARSSIDGIGFAIPVETMKSVADALIAEGRVSGRAALGVTVGPIPADAADYFGIPDGLYVSAVTPGSDAAKKGVVPGDIIVSVDGEHVSEIGELSAIISGKGPGGTVSLDIYRYGGEDVYLDVELMDSAELY